MLKRVLSAMVAALLAACVAGCYDTRTNINRSVYAPVNVNKQVRIDNRIRQEQINKFNDNRQRQFSPGSRVMGTGGRIAPQPYGGGINNGPSRQIRNY